MLIGSAFGERAGCVEAGGIKGSFELAEVALIDSHVLGLFKQFGRNRVAYRNRLGLELGLVLENYHGHYGLGTCERLDVDACLFQDVQANGVEGIFSVLHDFLYANEILFGRVLLSGRVIPDDFPRQADGTCEVLFIKSLVHVVHLCEGVASHVDAGLELCEDQFFWSNLHGVDGDGRGRIFDFTLEFL